MENNLVYNTKTGSFHQHYGKENVVRNNILVCSENPQIAATRVEGHLSFTLEHNIVYWKTGALFGGPWTRIRAKVDKNCYFNATGDPVTFAGNCEVANLNGIGVKEHRSSMLDRTAECSEEIRVVELKGRRQAGKHGISWVDGKGN